MEAGIVIVHFIDVICPHAFSDLDFSRGTIIQRTSFMFMVCVKLCATDIANGGYCACLSEAREAKFNGKVTLGLEVSYRS